MSCPLQMRRFALVIVVALSLGACGDSDAASLAADSGADRANDGDDADTSEPKPSGGDDEPGLDASAGPEAGASAEAGTSDGGLADASASDGGGGGGSDAGQVSTAAATLGADLVFDPNQLEPDLRLPAEAEFPQDLLPPR